jgi:hypothetical protein
MQFDLEAPQFLTAELLACVPGLGGDAFKQWLQRRTVVLSAGENIGRGRKPVYRGTDVIQVAAIYELTRQGMMASKATLAWQTVLQGRLIAWRTGLAMHDPPYGRGVFFAIHPDTGELIAQEFSEGVDEQTHLDHPDAPDVLILFRIDRFIVRMIERMQRVKAGEAVGEAKAPRSPYEESLDYLQSLGRVVKDQHGNRLVIGLSEEETREYVIISERLMADRMSASKDVFASLDEKMAAKLRYEELQEKVEAAVFSRTAPA